MFTSLDLLVIVFLILAVVTVLSLALMFLIRNRTAKKVFFYITTALSLYIAWVGFRIGLGGYFLIQMAAGIVASLMSIGAFVVQIVNKDNEKMFLIARIISAAALVLGFFNAIL